MPKKIIEIIPKLYREIINEYLIKDTKYKESNEESESVNNTLENLNILKIVFVKNNFKVVNLKMYITMGEKQEVLKQIKKAFEDVYENLVNLK